jgi:hypothetical protein
MTLGEFRRRTADLDDKTLVLAPSLSYGFQKAYLQYAKVTEDQDEIFVHSDYKHTNNLQEAVIIS